MSKTKTQPLFPKVKMNATQRRQAVAVARDVILQLRTKRFLAGGYGYLDLRSLVRPVEESPRCSFQKTFQETNESCGVCAIGAAYISYINCFNKVTNKQVRNANVHSMIGVLESVFSSDQLRLMEAVFEGGWVREPEWFNDLVQAYYDGEEENEFFPAHQRVNVAIDAYHSRYGDSDQLLRAIMLNVIRNNGEFRLPLKNR